jgi:hypothetical protein
LAGWQAVVSSQPVKPQAEPAAGSAQPQPSSRVLARLRAILVPAIVIGLVCYNLFFYLPGRFKPLHGLYGVSRSNLKPFQTKEAQSLTPAIVIVHTHEKWIEYGTLLELQSPYLDSPFIFVISRGEEADRKVTSYFPQRRVLHYDPLSKKISENGAEFYKSP